VSELVSEIALRLAKVVVSTLVGLVIYLVATGLFGATPSVELGLLAWIAGAAFTLLVASSPI
jgi:hypothetical protein